MKNGEILDGPNKGGYVECSHKTLYLPAALELTPLADDYVPLEFINDNVEYIKVLLERGTIYGWILK